MTPLPCALMTYRHPSDEGGDSPPVEVKEEERKEIFATRQELGEVMVTLGGEMRAVALLQTKASLLGGIRIA